MGALLNENQFSYGLETLGQQYLGVGKDERMLQEVQRQMGLKSIKEVKGKLWSLPASLVAPYAEQDGDLTLNLVSHLQELCAKEELDEAVLLEHDLFPVLTAMRKNGVRVNQGRAMQLRRIYLKREKDLIDEIRRQTGVRVDAYNAADIARALGTSHSTDCSAPPPPAASPPETSKPSGTVPSATLHPTQGPTQ
jgi:DNA polymerase I-like protein with 3'-5' exonuclease and polymerase domains